MMHFAHRMSTVHRSFIREILKVTEDPGIISFAGGLPNPKFFPVREVAEAAQHVLASAGESTLQYATTEGFPPLRELIAERYARKGVRVKPQEILIVNGSQQGLDLIGKVFLDAGDVVLVEQPTYLAAIQSFGIFEPRFRSVPLEEEGVSREGLGTALAQSGARLFYAIPNFQNPSGISYSEERRRAAAALIQRSSTVLVEDDPYGELRFIGADLPPIRSFFDDPNAHSLLLGTFSKIVSPGLRIGWVCAGHEVMEKLVVAKQASDLHSNVLAQRIVHHYLSHCDVAAHIERIRAGYGAQRDLMVDMVGRVFPPEVTCTHPEGGMFLWMTLPVGVSALTFFERALEQKVAFVPGQAFFADGGGENTLRLNFSNSDPASIEEGMTRLGRVYAGLRAGEAVATR
jgi:2-aminoadipate transaminase